MEMKDVAEQGEGGGCYAYEILNYEKGLFDRSIDITYILTMEHAVDRHASIREQLKKHQPTSRVVLVYNKGYKLSLIHI